MNHNRNQAKMFNMFLMVAHYSIAYRAWPQGSIYDGWMDEWCFRPLLCTVKAELGRGQPGLMR